MKTFDDNKYQREYRIKNREKRIKQATMWNLQNKDKHKAYQKTYRKTHKDKLTAQNKAYYSANRAAWKEIINAKGMNKCIKCGYSKCFAALDFHHINKDEKEFGISRMLTFPITAGRIKELDKCVCLCSNCHREEHNSTNGA